MISLKAFVPVLVIVGALFLFNVLTGGGLMAMVKPTRWHPPKGGDPGSQSICTDSCSCRLDESCVDGTCHKWGCVLSPIGRGGCDKDARCTKVDGVPVCVRSAEDAKCR